MLDQSPPWVVKPRLLDSCIPTRNKRRPDDQVRNLEHRVQTDLAPTNITSDSLKRRRDTSDDYPMVRARNESPPLQRIVMIDNKPPPLVKRSLLGDAIRSEQIIQESYSMSKPSPLKSEMFASSEAMMVINSADLKNKSNDSSYEEG